MVDEIARVMGNIVQIAETGKVDKVKEITPRPEEGRNMPSPFSEIILSAHKEKKGKRQEKKAVKSPTNETYKTNEEDNEGSEGQSKIDVVV